MMEKKPRCVSSIHLGYIVSMFYFEAEKYRFWWIDEM